MADKLAPMTPKEGAMLAFVPALMTGIRIDHDKEKGYTITIQSVDKDKATRYLRFALPSPLSVEILNSKGEPEY